MKSSFQGYYNLEKDEFDVLWNDALIIFDTNILLNLYRYQESTRDSLLKIMEALEDRAWIPYHVGLEYQRNRLAVIAEQKVRFTEVKTIVNKAINTINTEFGKKQLRKRHSHINPDTFIEKLKGIQKEFVDELSKLEQNCITVNSKDEIRSKLDSMFQNRIGNAPKTQKQIDDLVKDGEERFLHSIPPGYKDDEKKSNEVYTYGGIKYIRKYGDLIIWNQIIEHAKASKTKNILFVTDDSKADWLWKENCDGAKTVGVRPELRDEIYRKANVSKFHIYNTEGFLKYAKERLNAQVTKEAIDEVRAVSFAKFNQLRKAQMHNRTAMSAERAVYSWLSDRVPGISLNEKDYPDFIGYIDGEKYGFEVKLISGYASLANRTKELLHKTYYTLKEEDFYEITLFFVVLEDISIKRVEEFISRHMYNIKGRIKVILGKVIQDDQNDNPEFIPYQHIVFGKDI